MTGQSSGWDPQIIATVLGGIITLLTMVGGPLVAYLFGRGNRKFDEATKLRDELWTELHQTRELNRELSKTNQELMLKLSEERAAKAAVESTLAVQIVRLEERISDLNRENRMLKAIMKKNGMAVPEFTIEEVP